MAMFDFLRKTYAGKKVFVTGHTGFKGGWLVELLSLLGAEVKGYALPPKGEHNFFSALQVEKKCQSVIADIRDARRLQKEVADFQPDFIFHLAAQPLVRLSYQIPAETFEVNALGTAHLLDAVRALEKRCCVILITTDKVYHNYEWIYPYRENDRLGGYDPYSASKACAELVIDSYRSSFFNAKDYGKHQKSVASVRAGNVIGGGDWAQDRLIPDVVRALQAQQPIVIRNPQAVRPWQHVLEPLSGYLLLGCKMAETPLQYSNSYNFGPNIADTLRVEEMVQQAIEIWKNGRYEIQQSSSQPHEAGLLKLDISRAYTELGWQPRMNAREALTYTLEWYRSYYSKQDLQRFTQQQVKDFFRY